ncbi:hypothetical protein ABK040_002154 [Willaertia magna]
MVNLQSILNDEKLKHYVNPEKVPVTKLDVKEAWNALTDQQKLYAHYISRASLAGMRIVLHQVSEESPLIFDLLNELFKDGVVSLKEKVNVTKEQFEAIVNYAVSFYGNMGNYLSFGDSKFIPRLEQTDFENIVKLSGNQKAIDLFNQVKDKMYSLENSVLELSFGNSGYYSRDVTQEVAEKIKKFMEEKEIRAENTRLFKTGNNEFELRLASEKTGVEGTHTYGDLTIKIVKGDFSREMGLIKENLQKAIPYAANEHQVEMLKKYVQFFEGGNVQDHIDSQISWVKDISPVIENNIGFIESYRDPLRVRSEFEGFVAMVNKVASQKAANLVNNAEKFIQKLPWNVDTTNGDKKPFEVVTFTKPDFTSLEVLTFSSSGLPAGINIPNYDQVRERIGFKNVSLGNVLNAPTGEGEVITFLNENDKQLFKEFKGKAFEVQVLIHELLGHGSGKLIRGEEEAAGVINPITKQPVTSFYKAGETFNSVIGEISNAYEECRAECVGIYLSLDKEIMSICGHEGEEADTIIYVNWLLMVRAGLLGLQFYNPENNTWLQAHMRARYSILRVLLEAGEGLVEIKKLDNDLLITLNKDKINTVGRKAIYDYLLKINVYKSIGDKDSAVNMFNKYTSVEPEFLEMRKIVLDKKQPRKVFIQPHTTLTKEGTSAELVDYEISEDAMIQSHVAKANLF